MDLIAEGTKELTSWEAHKWHDSGLPGLIKAIQKAIQRTEDTQKRNADIYNEYNRHKLSKFIKTGTLVLVMNERKTNLDRDEHQKLLPLWKGPYKIISEIKENTLYQLDIEGTLKETHVDRLKTYYERPEWMLIPEEEELAEESSCQDNSEDSVQDDPKDKDWQMGDNY
jgi:hypothetical protein